MAEKVQHSKCNFTYLFIIIYSFVVKLINCIASPIYPDYCFQADNAILYLMGKEIMNGKVLYKELADNKTPYIYFMNGIASLLGYRHIGIFILEVILIVITLILIYKICKLYLDDDALALVGVVAFSVLLNNAYIMLGMSKTEGYVMPIMLAYFYILLKFYKNGGEWVLENSFFLGALATFSFMCNQKTALIYIPSYIILLINFILDKKKEKVVKSILFSLVGLIVVMAPYIIYMIATNSVKEAYYCAVTSALNYVSKGASYTYSNDNIFMSTMHFVGTFFAFFFFIIISIIIVCVGEKNKSIKWTYLTTFVFTLFAVTAANKSFSYYLALFYPFLLPIHILFANKCKGAVKEVKRIILIFATVFCFIITLAVGYKLVINQYKTRHNCNENFKKVLNKYYNNLDDIKVLALAFNPEVYMGINMKLDFPYFVTMNNTYQRVAKYYNMQLKYVRDKAPDVIVIRPESSYIYFPVPMQEEIETILAENYQRVEDVDTRSNYGIYNIYIKK